MGLEGRDSYLRALRQRRMEFLAGKVCETCGSPDRLEARWRVSPGPIRVTQVWQTAPRMREEYCKLLRTQCVSCRNKENRQARRVEHGGGTQGIRGCKCLACRAARARYISQWRRAKRERQELLTGLAKRPSGTMGQ